MMTSKLERAVLAGLLPDDVLGVPVRPVRIVLAGPLLVLAVQRPPHGGARSRARSTR